MAHLGANVAAFVDGQLDHESMRAAERHVEECPSCRHAVQQQRILKSRMQTAAPLQPPPDLIASLSGLAGSPPPASGPWARARRSAPFRAGLAMVSASMAVVLAAWLVGSADDSIGDAVSPDFDRYAANFFGATASPAANTVSDTTLTQLDDLGWPCHETLAGTLHRTSGAFVDGTKVIALSYSDGQARLNLFEEPGNLAAEAVDGFEPEDLGEARVWVRDGVPLVVAWDAEGVVYTMVTDAGRERALQAARELPAGARPVGPMHRVTDGLSRMSSAIRQ